MVTVTTTAGNPIDDNQFPIMTRAHGLGLPRAYQPIERLARRNRTCTVEKVMKTIGKIGRHAPNLQAILVAGLRPY